MNMNPQNNEELRSLVDAMCDARITPEQADRLQEIIATDESALDFYIQYMWMNDGVSRLSSGYTSQIDATLFESKTTPPNSTDNTGDDDMVATTASQQVWKSQPASGTSTRRDSLNWKLILSIAGLLAVIALIASQFLTQSDPLNQIAVGGKEQKQPGVAPIPFIAQTVEAESLQRQALSDGTILIARAGAKFNIDRPRQITLESGELYLIVAKSDQPFVVKTNDGEVMATGTRFTVSATDKTEAAVAQGHVVMKSANGEVELGVGQKGTLTKTERPTRSPARRLSHLVNWAKAALQQDELLVEAKDQENGLIAIDPYGQEAKLSLRKYDVDVYIEDGIARTTIDQTFFNHNPWNTEGTFYFPLPPDASVSRLAMYVAGQLNEGGMVSRQRGQEIYTEILHQRRDPALLEMMEGNMFKMRIFPLEGRQEKRIFLSYTQNLNELYGTTKYWFPMDHTNDVANALSIRVRIKDGARQFRPGSSTHDLDVATDGDDLVMKYTAEKIKPDQDFLLSLIPQNQKPADEVRVAVCEKDGQNYLSAKLRPDLTGDHDPEPRQWIVLNDVSASRSDIDVQTQRYILKRLIEEADDDDSVFLMDLNTQARNVSVRPVNVRSDDVKPLLNHRPKRMIGATNIAAGLDAVEDVIRKHDLKNPHLVYLGDGVATDGEKAIAELPRLIPSGCKFVGVGIGKKVDSMFLQEAANQTGGMFTTINPNEDIDWRVFDMLAALNTPRMTNIRVALLDENDRPMEAIAYPSSTVLAAGETITVTAMCDKKLPSTIQFKGQIGQRPVTKTAVIKNAKQGAEYLPRLWAKQHIDSLLKSRMSSEEEIIALSKDFYVVTPFTSLIVLEDDKMYEEYDVERGRKDHWASYDAPKTIEVIKEPVDWNRWNWGWRNFEGEDSKIDATTQPKSVQEIVDNIQVRINAPFYLWNEAQQNESRSGLYRLCEQEMDAESDPTRWLTLWFLLASGERQSAIDWGTTMSGGSGDPSTDGANTESGQPIVSRKPTMISPRLNERLIGGQFNGWYLSNDIAEGIMRYESFVPRTESLTRGAQQSKQIQQQSQFRTQALSRFSILVDEESESIPVQLLQSSSLSGLSADISPRLETTFRQALSTRMSRIERDIEKYNRQHGGYWGGRWTNTRSRWGDIDINGNGNVDSVWIGDGLNAMFGTDGNFEGKERLSLLMGEPAIPLDIGMSINGRFAVQQNFGNRAQDGFVPLSGNFDLGGRRRLAQQLGFFEDEAKDLQQSPMYNRISGGKRWKQMAPRMFMSASQQPIRTQPGMASVLAADYLHQRLVDLQTIGELDKGQTAEKQAIEVAISKMERVGARAERSDMFWGHSGWNYQPRPQTLAAPTVQAYTGYSWSFDLTRYADGLYSDSADMLHEVTRHYGTAKPLGTIDESTRRLIEDSRSNLRPVAIQFDKDGLEVKVGPHDQFAMTQRNDMYLTEELVCDGKNIIQVYNELGMAARREASEIRLAPLRQLAPHLIAPVDSMIQWFDVELVESNDDSFVLKLSVAPQDTKPDNRVSHTEDGDDKPVETDTPDEKLKNETDHHLLVKVDREGRVLFRKWMQDDEPILTMSFEYDDNQVTASWKLDGEKATEKDTVSYSAKPFAPTLQTFSVDVEELVVFDMPLKKPSFYQQKLQDLKNADDEQEKPIPIKDADDALELIRHEILAHVQDFTANQWGSGTAKAIALLPEMFSLIERLEKKPGLGDAVLCGSTGAQPSQYATLDNQSESPTSTVIKFFGNRYNWKALEPMMVEETGLIGHLSAYHVAVYSGQQDQAENFQKSFDESPLGLALIWNSHGSFSIDRLVELNKNPRWSGLALLVASTRCGNDDDKQKVASAFWNWQDELEEKGDQPFITDSVIRMVRSVDPEKTTKFLAKQLGEVQKLGSLTALMDFAEQLSSWGETKLADQAYADARKKLELDGDGQTPLLKRFAFGQSLWAGSRYKQALEQYDLIMAEFKEKKIPVSPSFLAAMARLAQQAGDHQRSVELEEQALELEQPYLPDAINLASFRQRYQWLWNQYDAAIKAVGKNDAQRESKIDQILERATKTWDRWNEVDGDNPAIPGQMATLLKTAGRDELAWEYLSSLIDLKPRDASSYTQLGSWYQGQGDLATAVRWFKEAPQWDTANPQWIFNYGSALKQMGRKGESEVQFQKIIDGKWAPGLQNWVDRAKAEL